MDSIVLGDVLGEGTFGKVVKVTKNDKHYAMKEIKINAHNENILSKEVNIFKELKHKNIVRYYGDWKSDCHSTWYILMEYCDSTLRKLILRKVFLQNNALCLKYLKEICSGLAFMHERGFLHLDLKPDNILVANGTIKIADFGLSKKCTIAACRGSQIYGTFVYIAPEILNSKTEPFYTDKVDLYALGVVLYEMVKPPLTKEEYISLINYPEKHLRDTSINANIAEIDLKLLSSDPLERPSAAELLKKINSINMFTYISAFLIAVIIVTVIVLICFVVFRRNTNRPSPMNWKDVPVSIY